MTLPIDISSQIPDDGNTSETSLTPSVSQYHANVVRGDLQEEVWSRHWLPTLIGCNNVIEYYRDLLDEEEMAEIKSGIIGSQSHLLMTIGHGFEGLSSLKRVDSLQDHHDNFVLLWLPPR